MKYDFNKALPESMKYDFNKKIPSNASILEKYGLAECFNALNESDENIGITLEEQNTIKNQTADALKKVESKDKSAAKKMADSIKGLYKRFGKKVFLCGCIMMTLLSGNASASLARSLSRINSNEAKQKIEMSVMNDLYRGGGSYISNIINQFVDINYFNLDNLEKKNIRQDIINNLKGQSFRFILVSNHCKLLKDAYAETIKDANVKVIKQYKNKDVANKLGKYQVLTIYETVA